jgi:hypothetical protein
MWKTVYLQSLADRKKWRVKQPNLEVGDVVLEIKKDSAVVNAVLATS